MENLIPRNIQKYLYHEMARLAQAATIGGGHISLRLLQAN